MLARRLSPATSLACAAVAGLMLLTSASYAQNRHDQIFPKGAYGTNHAPARALYPTYGISTPKDFVSSHVCINGYRWITRDRDHGWEDPAQNAVPVRC